MIEKNIKFEILNQKVENIEKLRHRFFSILLILPIIFFLLKNSIIKEVDLSIFSIKQINLLLLFLPSLYMIICLYIMVLSNHNSKLVDEINYLVTEERDVCKQYEKEKWLKLIQPINILANLLGSIKTGGSIGCLGSIFVYFPLIISIIIYPIGSYICFLIYNFENLGLEYHSIALGNIIFSFWILIAIIIYQISSD